MPALNFKKQFVPAIQDRTKQHTIRADRKDGKVPKPGDLYSLYCGMRTKNCFRILPGLVTITQVRRIEIFENGLAVLESQLVYTHGVRIDGVELSRDECQGLARADGFRDFGHMMLFWVGRFPFSGHIIHWK